MAAENHRLRRELAEQRRTLDAYAEQLNSDFEELTWLRGISNYLEHCDVTKPVSDVAAHVLPPLRELIRAESLVLIPKDQIDRQDGEGSWVCHGADAISLAECRRIIAQSGEAACGEPLVKNRADCEPGDGASPRIRSFILTPLAHGRFRAGWLLAVNRMRRPALPGELALCGDDEFGTAEAGLIGIAAVTLTTHARNVELFREQEVLLVGVIRALINAMDAKDGYTCGHSDRVALIARRLGEELGLSPGECERLYVTGLLHDIGKIGVPDNVLLKPDRLTDDEFAQIRRHPVIGHSILRHLTQFQYALPGVLHHHECVDGRGYPRGLSGEEIPLAARVLAVADAYDAMTSSRPYRTAMPAGKAEAILREGAGRQWDAGVVEAFFRSLDAIHGICEGSESHTQDILKSAASREVSEVDSIVAAVRANRQ